MKFQITGKDWSSIIEIDENVIKSTDNECISIFTGKNWEHIKEKCKQYGWDVEEIEEIIFMEPTALIEVDDAKQI